MSEHIKSVAAIHDLSGYGRCSLSVIAPILSVMGLQCVSVPTAVLSTHTGGFGEVAITDLTEFVKSALEHYKTIGLNFDCIYSGFMASEKQIEHCLEFIQSYKKAFIVVDPVMGDNGTHYKTYTKEMCRKMSDLVKAADLITPNKTEACILLDLPFSHSSVTRQTAKEMLLRLSELGPRQVVITGLEMADMSVCNVGYDRDANAFWCIKCSYVNKSYPGTGDMFAAILVGALLSNDSLAIAIERATRFLELSIKTTYSYGSDSKQGVMLEKTLPWLATSHFFDGYQPL